MGNFMKVKADEYKAVEKASYDKVIETLQPKKEAAEETETVEAPPKEVVTASISGIEILDLEDAVQALWKEGIYAESGMGCTGPIVMITDANHDKATEILKNKGFI